ILTGSGEVLIETPGMAESLPAASFPSPSTEPSTGGNCLSVKSNATKARMFRVQSVRAKVGPSQDRLVGIQVAMDRSERVELLENYRTNLWLGLGVALVLCTLIGHQIAHRGIRPVHRITETARHIRPTHLDERIRTDDLPAELLLLADTFNQMLDRLEQSF